MLSVDLFYAILLDNRHKICYIGLHNLAKHQIGGIMRLAQEDVLKVQQAVNKFVWNKDFQEFKRRTGFTGSYAEKKWFNFQELRENLSAFDIETLCKIVNEQEVTI